MSYDMETAMIITAGEVGILKIWDASLHIKQQIDVRQALDIQDLKNIKSYGIQSLDIFPCDRQTVNSTATVKVLAGMRSGDVMEVQVDFNRNYVNADDIISNPKYTEEQKVQEL